MPTKKQLIKDTITGKLSRLKAKDLPLVGIDGLNDGDIVSPFGTLTTDIIEYHVYDTDDNYTASGLIEYPLPTDLDVGSHVRNLGYERGTYKIVYNFLRQIGGSHKVVLTKKSDKSIYTGQYMVETNGKILASHFPLPDVEPNLEVPLTDDNGNEIELLVQDDKFWLQEISPSRTEIRLRPNPAINDIDYYEQFRLLGYTCLSYSDVSGTSDITFESIDGKTATINNGSISLNQAMVGGTLKIREAFVIDHDETPEVISRYFPLIENTTLNVSNNIVTNGHFSNGLDVEEKGQSSVRNSIVDNIANPGNTKFVLKTQSVGSEDMQNKYQLLLKGIPGENYIISCWVHWTPEWTNNKTLFIGGINSPSGDIHFNDGIAGQTQPRAVSETIEVDGNLWERYYKVITIPEDSDGNIDLQFGHTNEETPDGYGERYITNIQVEPGSLGGIPTPYMEVERPEEVDVPISGQISFISDPDTETNQVVEAILTEEDDGFIDSMVSGEGRGSGVLTIKDAYVVDEVFSEDTELIVIDDIPLKNPLATDIRKYEREFRVSPYHGGGTNRIWIRVDNTFTITSFNSLNVPTVIGTTHGVAGAYKESYTYALPDDLERLEIQTRNNTKGAGFLAKIKWNGSIIRTGDGEGSYEDENEDWKRDHYGDSGEIDVPEVIYTSTNSSGPFEIISNSTNAEDLNWSEQLGKSTKTAHKQLRDCDWVWSTEVNNSQDLVWQWIPEGSVTDLIWQYPDPILYSDAVRPNGWSDGFNSFNWGGSETARIDQARWHSGWLGHHAKWIQGEGQFGETCMKFIDKNSEFLSPNHVNYPTTEPHRTGLSSAEHETLSHRWMGISQTLPHAMVAQGIEPGNKITVSWWQKSDTVNKGAMVGLHHYRKSDGNVTWGTSIGTHPATLEEGSLSAGEREFFKYRPVSKIGEWEQVSWTGVVYEDWDLAKPTTLYVYGHYGPEGILWVESPTIQLTESTTVVNRTPVTADLVAPIQSIDGNKITLFNSYESLAPENVVLDNSANIRSFTKFSEFYVDYTSSLYSSEPIYGSLRGEIDSIDGNNITLVNSYSELGQESNHDFDKYSLSDMQPFGKWFVQYAADKSENLSKLIKLGANDFSLITNFKVDQTTYSEYPYSVVYKLYEPLPDEIVEKDFVTVVREMIPPIEETCTLIPFIEEEVSEIVLRTPEFANTNSPIGPGTTEYKNYTKLTSTDGGIKESVENEVISGSLSTDINVDYSQFENFIHFSSAEQRLRNFKYKLDLIEQYTDRSASLAGTSSGSTGKLRIKASPGTGAYLNVSASDAYNPSFQPVSGSLVQIQSWEQKRRDTINSFDKFEKYMFNNSSSYSSESIQVFNDNAWPKEYGGDTYSSPYVLYRTSQSAATTWYADQLISASTYDRSNKHRLKGHLPMFVQDDDENNVFLKFVDMIGHHFDDMWIFIKSMTDVHDKRDKLTEGIAKDLLKPVAQSLGWEVHDGKDLISLPRYMFGMEQTGSETPWEYSGTPERDISREIWSRIINNMPYFLKTKGTVRSLKGLISCYGIPSSILRVIEYGGPKLSGQTQEYFLTRKFTKALNFKGSTNNTYVQNDTWEAVTLGDAPTSRHPDTVEFRFRAASGSNQVLVRRGDDWAIRLKDNDASDNRGYVSFMLSGSDGEYKEVSSSEFPVYDNEFWSVMLTRTMSGSLKSFVSSDASNLDVDYTLYTKKYDAGRSKIIYESQNTLTISGSFAASASYNSSYTGSSDTITLGGPEHATFGESLSGSMMEYRNWTTPLNVTSFDNHVAAPIAFDGNTPSASYLDLVTRYSFDDDKDLSVSYNQWFRDASADQSFTSSAVPHNYTSVMGDHFSSVVDETKMKVPNLGPSGRSSRKVRIEADELIDKVGSPALQFGKSITVPAYDKAPIDSNKLGIFFSPSAAIDEDIILSMPNLDFDQFIGDPRDQYKEQYTGLVEARNLYWQKYSGPNNFWDYLRLIKYYDSSLYRQLKSLVPARANATIGILIEPTILERDKIITGKEPTATPHHHFSEIDIHTTYVSESAEYQVYEDRVNWSSPFGIDKHKMETGSYISSSAQFDTFEADLTFTDPFRVNFYTMESGSSEQYGSGAHKSGSGKFGFVSASATDITPWGLETMPLNFYDPHRLNNRTQDSGSGVAITAAFSSYEAPSDTISANASGTGSFVIKHILERPALYNIGDIDTSGWYGQDYYNSTIQAGSVKTIFEEVVQPRIETNIMSQFNDEIEYYYSSSLSASMHKAYSSSFVRSDLDSRWDEAIGTDRLFYTGCVQTDSSTVTDPEERWLDDTPAVDITIVSPTKLVTTDKTTTKMDVKNK